MFYTSTLEDVRRKGCRDVWNAGLVNGAVYSSNDIPFCPTTMSLPPEKLITFEEAKISKDYKAGVMFYKDDYRFDGIKSGIWADFEKYLKIVSKFEGGVITPDFATNRDLPDPWIRFNIYRMRACGFGFVKNGLKVCNNIRWGTEKTWEYCFDGVEKGSMVAVSTHGSIRKSDDRICFKEGFYEMIRVLEPSAILVYGNCPDDIFGDAKAAGINLITYKSEMSQRLGRRK